MAGITLSRDQEVVENIRRRVGLVFQQFNLFPHLTVLETAPCRCGWCGLPKPRRGIGDALPFKVRILSKPEYHAQLSGGQQSASLSPRRRHATRGDAV